MKAKYIGPIEHLKGKIALIYSAVPGHVIAQFHEMNLTRSAVHPPPERFEGPWPDDSLGLGWHAFPASHFEFISHKDN